MDCDFVTVGGVTLPAVASVVMTPVYIKDSERAISGVLRTDYTATAREWRVELRGVPGDELGPLLDALMQPTPTRPANIMGVLADVEVTVEQVQHRPKVRGRAPGPLSERDKNRADVTLVLTETVSQIVFPAGSTADSTSTTVDVR